MMTPKKGYLRNTSTMPAMNETAAGGVGRGQVEEVSQPVSEGTSTCIQTRRNDDAHPRSLFRRAKK